MVTGLLALALAVMKLFPDTPLARSLHCWLVEWPIAAAERMERRHVILVGIILFCGPSLAAFGSAEIAMLYAADLSLYVEAVVMTSVSAAGLSLRKGWTAMLRGVVRPRRGAARPRSRRFRSPRGRPSAAANDDDPAGYPAAALAA